MPSIEQRILLPASPELVWQYIGEPEKHPLWWQECERAIPLSATLHEPGSRWRYIHRKAPDFVIEITTYLSRAGFEYSVVDGLPILNAHGRFRLQEVNEGTALFWGFEFQSSGFFSRSGRRKRAIESQMHKNLRNLWQIIHELPERSKLHDPRTSVQEAPDADFRATYIPRHENRLPPDDVLAAAAAIPAISEDTQPLQTLDENEIQSEYPPADLEDTAAVSIPTPSQMSEPNDEDTPAKPIPTINPTTSTMKMFDTSVMNSLEEELSIFDIFGIQRFSSTTAEDVLHHPTEDQEEMMEVQTDPIVREENLSSERTREGARTRLRRKQLLNIKKNAC